MLFGIGTDIVQVSRMHKWVEKSEMIERFFNPCEWMSKGSQAAKCQHYAARFAAKEAFSKALGTGLKGFELKDIFVVNNEQGKPEIKLEKSAEEIFAKICPGGKINLSISHEKEYAAAFVVIEQ